MSDVGVVWHDVECGGYDADLPIWERLASETRAPVLELGCGTGRVALHLARRGHSVIGLDHDPELIDSLRERGRDLPVQGVLGDLREPKLDTEVGLAIAPMQVLQLLPGAGDRARCFGAVASLLAPGGCFAAAIVERLPGEDAEARPIPDVRDVDGWVYSSLPVDLKLIDGDIVVRRLRQAVSPAGALEEEPNEIRIRELSAQSLEEEAAAAGLAPVERLPVPPTDLHIDSTVVVLARES
jgi:SAM-dependent methyltransferase